METNWRRFQARWQRKRRQLFLAFVALFPQEPAHKGGAGVHHRTAGSCLFLEGQAAAGSLPAVIDKIRNGVATVGAGGEQGLVVRQHQDAVRLWGLGQMGYQGMEDQAVQVFNGLDLAGQVSAMGAFIRRFQVDAYEIIDWVLPA